MNREKVINHIVKAVKDSQPGNKKTDNEIINKVYRSIKPHASIRAKSARRIVILSGDYFSENIVFFLELVDQCGLDIVERN